VTEASFTVAILRLRVKDNAPAGNTTVDIGLTNLRGENNLDLRTQNNIIPGIVTVVDFLIGDVNGDGEVDDWDVTFLARHLAGWPGVFETINKAAADVNGDGEVDDWDVTFLARHLAGWPGIFETLGAQ
jgi:hypothetical protein